MCLVKRRSPHSRGFPGLQRVRTRLFRKRARCVASAPHRSRENVVVPGPTLLFNRKALSSRGTCLYLAKKSSMYPGTCLLLAKNSSVSTGTCVLLRKMGCMDPGQTPFCRQMVPCPRGHPTFCGSSGACPQVHATLFTKIRVRPGYMPPFAAKRWHVPRYRHLFGGKKPFSPGTTSKTAVFSA